MEKIGFKRIFGLDIDATYCSSTGKEVSFAINIGFSFTNGSITGLFSFRAQHTNFGEVLSSKMEVKEIKGRLI